MHGEITLSGVTLTLEEWESLDEESRRLLLLCSIDEAEPAERVVREARHAALDDEPALRPW
jgi:hypothetical protein